MLTEATESAFVSRLAGGFLRSPRQENKLHESDAELIRLGDDPAPLLAITIDSLIEEIVTGLYDNPRLIGWMAVMVNMSDLAAVGASPLGILMSESLPPDCPDEYLQELQLGIREACEHCGTYLLGGDTNSADRIMLHGCALGTVKGIPLLTRAGCRAGDTLYSSGPLGSGNAYALAKLGKSLPNAITYRPAARIKEGQILHGIASACMDSSDGVLATLDQLMRVNSVGFELDDYWEEGLDPGSRAFFRHAGLPPWFLLAGHHGEFELLFTVPREREQSLLGAAASIGWTPFHLGMVTEKPRLTLPLYGARGEIDTGRIRNIPRIVGTDLDRYLRELLGIDSEIRSNTDRTMTEV